MQPNTVHASSQHHGPGHVSKPSQLPIPTDAEVKRFRRLYQENIGVDLDSPTAERTLADLAQFYFLTRGHERYRLLHPDYPHSTGAKSPNA